MQHPSNPKKRERLFAANQDSLGIAVDNQKLEPPKRTQPDILLSTDSRRSTTYALNQYSFKTSLQLRLLGTKDCFCVLLTVVLTNRLNRFVYRGIEFVSV